jgi:hypothetical protein
MGAEAPSALLSALPVFPCPFCVIFLFFHHHHQLYTSSSGRPVSCMSILLKQHLNTHKQQLRTLGLQIIIHHTHAPVHKQSHRLTVTTTHQGTDVSERQG